MYRHYKGGLYRLIGIAEHTETGEALVIYQSEDDGRRWARPFDMFNGTVEVDGETVPRFREEPG